MLSFLKITLYSLKKDLNRCSTNFAYRMSEAIEQKSKENNFNKNKSTYKPRYNGKCKKRQWDDSEKTDISDKRPCLSPFDRIKKKKSILLLGYSGVNYFGMQRNPEMKTIEEDLLSAMLKNNWITDEGFKQAQTIQFQRAARTDKGVSAARQCVSLKLPDNLDLNALNASLPEQIKVFCIKRVTKGFNSKDQCNARTYTYTLPTVSLANFDENVSLESYRVSEEKIKQFNTILKVFEGTKNFHNFTSKKDYLDPSSKRFIMSFECGKPFKVQNDIEFVTIKVKGQSFMLHQIRKMIGLSLAIIRNLTEIETITTAFTEKRIDIPMAPGLGLVLDQVHYDRYNNRYGNDGIHEMLSWSEEEEDIKTFVDNFIFPTIINTEIKEKQMLQWLETLPLHSYNIRVDNLDEQKKEEEILIVNDDTNNKSVNLSSNKFFDTAI